MRSRRGEFHQITFGEQLKSYSVGGFQVVETRHGPLQRLHRHAHADASINFVITGALTETLGNMGPRRSYDCAPGTLLFKPADEYHVNAYGPAGARCLIVQPSSEQLDHLVHGRIEVNESVFTARQDAGVLLRRIHYEVQADDDLSPMAIEGYSLEVFSLLAGRARRSTSAIWLRRAERYLVDHSKEKINLGDIANALEIDPAVLSRRFREAFGVSPSRFIRDQRTRWAAQQLTKGTTPLSVIAAGAGFVDQSHFTRSFKNTFGVTPGRFRAITRYR